MKKIYFTLILGLALLANKSLAQEGVVLKAKMLPNSEYTTTMTTKATNSIDIKGSDKVIEDIKKSGMELPLIMLQNIDVLMTVSTAKTNADGNIPGTLKINKYNMTMTVNGKEIPSNTAGIENMEIYGKYDQNSKFSLDSITGEGVSNEMKTNYEELMKQMQQQVEFPDRPLKIGDSFETNKPLNMPMPGIGALNMDIKMVYTLKSIENGMATFSLIESITMGSKIQSMEMSATGSGTAVCVFDIAKGYVTDFTSKLPIELKMNYNNMDFTIKSDTETNSKVSLK